MSCKTMPVQTRSMAVRSRQQRLGSAFRVTQQRRAAAISRARGLVPARRRRFGRLNPQVRGLARQVGLQLAESKHVNSSAFYAAPYASLDGSGNRQYRHESLACIQFHNANSGDSIFKVNTGTNNSSRNGNEIYPVGVRLRGDFQIAADRKATKIKMWLVEWNSNDGTPTTKDEFFEDVNPDVGVDKCLINRTRFKPRLLRTLRLRTRDVTTTAGNSVEYNIWIPLKGRVFHFNTDNTAPKRGIKENMGIVCMFYENNATLSTDNVVTSHQNLTTFYYKDP